MNKNELIKEIFDLSRDVELERKIILFQLTKQNIELCLVNKENIPPSESKVLLNVTATYEKMKLAKFIKESAVIDFPKKLKEIMNMKSMIVDIESMIDQIKKENDEEFMYNKRQKI